mgnify:CR=1 FL=1
MEVCKCGFQQKGCVECLLRNIHITITERNYIIMAWYAELKRRHWYCINRWDAISWYRKHLYDTWYASLTEEQKATIEEQKHRADAKQKRELETVLMQLATRTTIVCGLSHGISNHDKYHSVYDENGFPIMNKPK